MDGEEIREKGMNGMDREEMVGKGRGNNQTYEGRI